MKRVGGGQGFNFVGEDVELSQITVEVESIEDVDDTAQIIETLLKKYHEKEDYAVVVHVSCCDRRKGRERCSMSCSS